MKGFLTWFKSSTKLKRWMLVILLGIALTCYGISIILVTTEMGFQEIIKPVVSFVIGFTMIILGLIYMQKRTLEILIEAEIEEELADVQKLIFNKNIYDKGPKVVVIGGGTGLSSMLKGLKQYTNNITAIINATEVIGEPQYYREQIEMLKFPDIKEAVIGLANDEILMDKLLNYNLSNDKKSDIYFGELYLGVMQAIYGDLASSVEATEHIFNITGKVLPVTLDKTNIEAELRDGTTVQNREKISEMAWKKVSPIHKVYVKPTNARPSPGVLESIAEADAIIIGPGSLYTNVIPNLLIRGVAKSIKESKAMKIYISNIMTEPGQTDDYSVSNHIDAIYEHVGRGVIDFCICDTGEITPEFIKMYNLKGSDLVAYDSKSINERGVTLIKKDLGMVKGEFIRHDPELTASAIIELICNDLKYKDKHNEEQYLLLNSKQKPVKEREKEIEVNKKIKNNEIKKQKNRIEKLKKESKFTKKYQERMESIKNSEKSRLRNLKNYEALEKVKKMLEEESKQKGK